MREYVEITPKDTVQAVAEPFRFTVDGERFELPNLGGGAIPLPLVPVFLAVSSGQVDSDEDRMRIAATFITYLEREQPRLWRALKRKDNALAWVVGLIEQWGEHAGLDPQRPASGD